MIMPATRFTQMLMDVNVIDPQTFQCWIFHPGMRFGSPDKWWGDYGRRDFPHEGIDLCLFKDRSGEIRQLGQGTRLPVMHDGTVKALFRDYLGHAVIIGHQAEAENGETFLSVYAHTRPADNIVPGTVVRRGQVIASIADTRRSKANILAHLHLTIGRPSPKFEYDPFIWNRMRDPELVTLLDPLPLLDWPWEAKR